MAGGIAKDINATTAKLGKLAQREFAGHHEPVTSMKASANMSVAKRKTLFDDRPIEISELTYIIRQDIAHLNTQIAALQAYVRTQKAGGSGGGKDKKSDGKQVEEHNSNVVMMLQSRLANMGMGFKDVLELRTQVSYGLLVRSSSHEADQVEHEGEQGPDRAVHAHRLSIRSSRSIK
jgi:syntaxin 5